MHPPAPTEAAPLSCAIDGPLVVSTVADWHGRLCARLTNAPVSAIDLAAVGTLDLFGLQLLLAAGRTAAAAGRPLTLIHRPAAFDELCRSVGLAPALFTTS